MCLGCMPNDYSVLQLVCSSVTKKESHLPRASYSSENVWSNGRQNNCFLQQLFWFLECCNVIPATKTIYRHFCRVL